MRLLGLVMLVMGSVGAGFSIRNTLASNRPKDVAFALLAWVSVVLALLGLALVFVPGFLG